MRETTYADEKALDSFSTLDDAGYAAITVRENIIPQALPPEAETETLDV